MKNKIKKYIGEILLLIGSFMLVFNILSFSGNIEYGSGYEDILNKYGIKSTGYCSVPIRYYYQTDNQIAASVGMVLALLGLLIIRQKENQRRA